MPPHSSWVVGQLLLLHHLGHLLALLLQDHTTARHRHAVQLLLDVVNLAVEVLHVVRDLVVQLGHAVEDDDQPGRRKLSSLSLASFFSLLLLLLLLARIVAPHPVEGDDEGDDEGDEGQEQQHLLRVFKHLDQRQLILPAGVGDTY